MANVDAAATRTTTTTTTTTGVTEAGLPKGGRLVLVLLPLQGHLSPMFQLGEILHSQGFSVTIIYPSFDGSTVTILNQPPTLRCAPFFVPLPEGTPLDDHTEMLLIKNAATVQPLVAKLRTLLSEEHEDKDVEEGTTCVITDPLLFAAGEAAREVGLPNVALWTGSSACFRVYAAFPMLREKGYFPPIGDLQQSEEEVAELPPFRVRDLPNFPNFNPESTYQLITRMVEHVTSSKALLLNTFETLEPTDTATLKESLLPLSIFPVGPLHKLSPGTSNTSLLPQDRTCLHWLDNLETPPRSVLYISFGSTSCVSKADLEEMAWGLANSRQYFLWVLRPGSIHGEEMEDGCSLSALLPEGFPEETRERGCIVGWAPQVEVLRHPRVGGFWTHCGWNSIVESLCEGVPMICWSYFADQMLSSRVVEDVWKVGIAVGKVMKREEVEKVVRKLMAEGEGREMWTRAMDIKAKAALSINRGRETSVGSSRWYLKKFTQFASSLK